MISKLKSLFTSNEELAEARENVLTQLDKLINNLETTQQKEDQINAAIILVRELNKLNEDQINDCSVGNKWLKVEGKSIKLISN